MGKGGERQGKERDGKGTGKETKRGRGEKPNKTTENAIFNFGGLLYQPPVPDVGQIWHCGPMVYSSMPDFIVIGIRLYTTTHNHAKMTDIENFWGLLYPEP